MICYQQLLKRKTNGEEEQKILRKKESLMIGVTLTMELQAEPTHASPYSLSVHYLIRQKKVWPIVNP